MPIITLIKKTIINIELAVLFVFIGQELCQGAPWPDNLEKQNTLEHCAKLLFSSFDTNQIEATCFKIITNQPAIIRLGNQVTRDGLMIITLITNEDLVSRLKDASLYINLNMIAFASQLTASNINTYISEMGRCATYSNSPDSSSFNLWYTNGPLKHLDKYTGSGNIIISADFYESGKLMEFRENAPRNEGISFGEDGKFGSYYWTTTDQTGTNNVEIGINVSKAGSLRIRGYLLQR